MDKNSCLETLVRCIVKGQSAGVFSIRDASDIYDIILHLRGVKPNEKLNEKDCMTSMVRAVILSHSKGVYSLEESSIIDKVIKFLAENDHITVDEPKKLETIKEEEEESGVKEV